MDAKAVDARLQAPFTMQVSCVNEHGGTSVAA